MQDQQFFDWFLHLHHVVITNKSTGAYILTKEQKEALTSIPFLCAHTVGLGIRIEPSPPPLNQTDLVTVNVEHQPVCVFHPSGAFRQAKVISRQYRTSTEDYGRELLLLENDSLTPTVTHLFVFGDEKVKYSMSYVSRVKRTQDTHFNMVGAFFLACFGRLKFSATSSHNVIEAIRDAPLPSGQAIFYDDGCGKDDIVRFWRERYNDLIEFPVESLSGSMVECIVEMIESLPSRDWRDLPKWCYSLLLCASQPKRQRILFNCLVLFFCFHVKVDGDVGGCAPWENILPLPDFSIWIQRII